MATRATSFFIGGLSNGSAIRQELVADCEAEGEAAAGTGHGIRFQSDAPTGIPTVGGSGNSSGIGAPVLTFPVDLGIRLAGLFERPLQRAPAATKQPAISGIDTDALRCLGNGCSVTVRRTPDAGNVLLSQRYSEIAYECCLELPPPACASLVGM